MISANNAMVGNQSDSIMPEPPESGQVNGRPPSKNRRLRTLIAYWILGLTNNYGYVVMLTAASDIIAKQTDNSTDTEDEENPCQND